MNLEYIKNCLERGDNAEARACLVELLQKQEEKKLSKDNTKNIVKKIVTNSKFAGHINVDDSFYFTDGFRIMETSNNLNYEAVQNPPNVSEILSDYKNFFDDEKKVTIDLAKLAVHIEKNKLHFNKKIIPFCVNDSMFVNAEYLQDLIFASNNNTIVYSTQRNCFFAEKNSNLMLLARNRVTDDEKEIIKIFDDAHNAIKDDTRQNLTSIINYKTYNIDNTRTTQILHCSNMNELANAIQKSIDIDEPLICTNTIEPNPKLTKILHDNGIKEKIVDDTNMQIKIYCTVDNIHKIELPAQPAQPAPITTKKIKQNNVNLSEETEETERTEKNVATEPHNKQDVTPPKNEPQTNNVHEVDFNCNEIFNSIKQYLNLCKIENKSRCTLLNYECDLKKWLMYCNDNNITSLEHVTKQTLIAFLGTLENLQATSKARTIATLKSYFKYLYEDGIITKNYMLTIKSPAIEKKLPQFLPQMAVDDMLTACYERQEFYTNAKRDYIILQLALNAGLRREEVTKIRLADVNASTHTILINGKGSKQRKITCSSMLMMLINEYISTTRQTYKHAQTSEFLFMSQKSKNIAVNSINHIINTYLSIAGYKEKGISFHALRKAFAKNAYERTGDILAVSLALGHESVETTKIYVGLDENRVKAAFLA